MSVSTGLGLFYLVLATMNAVASLYLWQRLGKVRDALVWLGVSGIFLLLAPMALGGSPPEMPGLLKLALDRLAGPVTFFFGTLVGLLILYFGRRVFVQPHVAWGILNLSLLGMGLAVTDPNFALIVTKPDNVPIVAMVFLMGYFTWLATYKAVQNDDRMREGKPPLESLDNEKVLVWPDLVYTEMICMVALTVILLVWSIVLMAPLEEPASSVNTPNPSKAPWYFLGLQEMLVYYDPWMAGVVLPSLVVFGLMAIPYIDFNKRGNGYYTIEERTFAYSMFQLGFLQLWVPLIVLGTFLRGPNWNFFGPFEFWDVHKVEALNNVNLSEYWYINLLNQPLPRTTGSMTTLETLGVILRREYPGIILVIGYFALLPPVMATTIFRNFFVKMGFVRYMVLANLLLFMAALPIKMLLRWTVDLKYIVAIPEYFLNF